MTEAELFLLIVSTILLITVINVIIIIIDEILESKKETKWLNQLSAQDFNKEIWLRRSFEEWRRKN